jgi:hypothetical protein
MPPHNVAPNLLVAVLLVVVIVMAHANLDNSITSVFGPIIDVAAATAEVSKQEPAIRGSDLP